MFFCHWREEKSSSKRSPSHQRNSHLNSSSDSPNLEVVGRRADVLIGRQSNMEKVDDVNSNATEESTYRVCSATFWISNVCLLVKLRFEMPKIMAFRIKNSSVLSTERECCVFAWSLYLVSQIHSYLFLQLWISFFIFGYILILPHKLMLTTFLFRHWFRNLIRKKKEGGKQNKRRRN